MNKNSNEKKYDTLIIGAGASGVVCAITSAKRGLKVALIDGNLFPAKKLLVTGNGRCNLTNKNLDNSFYNQKIDKFLKKFNNESTVDFFSSIGVETYFDDEGRCYPISNSSKSAVEALNYQIKKHGVDFYGESVVDKVIKKGENFQIFFGSEKCLIAPKLVVASGGNSLKNILENFNIKTALICPSLVSLKTVEQTKSLDGIRLKNVLVRANCGNKTFVEKGEVLFKDHGLSGIVIFNASSLFARSKQFEGDIEINLLPDLTLKNLIGLLSKRLHIFDKVSELFIGLFNKQIADEIIKRSGVNKDKGSKEISEGELQALANNIAHFKFKICGAYDNNQIFSGGVDLKDLNENLEHKNIKNLYFSGEVCDVDGVCGGYNLQWAFTSGYIVGESL